MVMTPTATTEFIQSYGLPPAASKVICVKYSASSWVIVTGALLLAAAAADPLPSPLPLPRRSAPLAVGGPAATVPAALTRMKCPSSVLRV